ncbi:hypothetical protein [Nocardioides sp.]|uniref:hypothetical protein n=1 Tax=Nocardioides sp. TaxID=35761 RepID=UPI002C6FD0FE|nr:hypothetical protein [Nocardioides sp.]HVX55919.1 hypothetical protein [Nocardioides sp.]
MRRLSTVLIVAAAVAALVLGSDYVSYAATGKSLLLGKLNRSPKATALARTKAGPVLDLRTKSGSDAPLRTNGTGLVQNLDADLLDGHHAADFAPDTLVGQVAGLTSGQGALQSQAATLGSQVGTLQSTTSTLGSQIGTLQSQTSTLQSQTTSLAGSMPTSAYVSWSAQINGPVIEGPAVMSAAWDGSQGRWKLTLPQPFSYSGQAVNVTPIDCPKVEDSITALAGGQLAVQFWNYSGSAYQAAQCDFYLTITPY